MWRFWRAFNALCGKYEQAWHLSSKEKPSSNNSVTVRMWFRVAGLQWVRHFSTCFLQLQSTDLISTKWFLCSSLTSLTQCHLAQSVGYTLLWTDAGQMVTPYPDDSAHNKQIANGGGVHAYGPWFNLEGRQDVSTLICKYSIELWLKVTPLYCRQNCW